MPSAAVLLADGLEEIEAVTIIDVLRRADIDVTTIGIEDTRIHGSHDINLEADVPLSDAGDADYDIVILPGGEPGSTHLEEDPRVTHLLKDQFESGGKLGAICAAPRIFAQNGFLDGKPATSHPSVETKMTNAEYTSEPVVKSGRIVTSRGPGTAIPFSLQIVQDLVGEEKAQELAEYMEFTSFQQ